MPPSPSLSASLSLTKKVLQDCSLLIRILPPGGYTSPCSVVQATAGQHVRHLLHHVSVPVSAAEAAAGEPEEKVTGRRVWEYDVRERGDDVENCAEAALAKIASLSDSLSRLAASPPPTSSLLTVAFSTASSSPSSTPFLSTIEREIMFGAHHGLHHLAMLRVLAEKGGGGGGNLPGDFGKAPSTVVFEEKQ